MAGRPMGKNEIRRVPTKLPDKVDTGEMKIVETEVADLASFLLEQIKSNVQFALVFDQLPVLTVAQPRERCAVKLDFVPVQ